MKNSKKITARLFLVLMFFIFFSFSLTPALASTWYVDDDGSNSDTGTSEAHAWKTITYAMTQAVSDDIVLVAAGNYDSGNTETFPIAVPAGVYLKSNASPSLLATIETTAARAITLNAVSTIEGFSVKVGAGADANGAIYLAGQGWVLSNYIYSSAATARGIYLNGSADNSIITGNTIDLSGSSGYGVYLYISADNVLIQNNTIESVASSAIGIYLYSNNVGFTITENTIRGGGYGSGIYSRSGVSIRNGTISTNEVVNYLNGIYIRAQSGYSIDVHHNTVVKFGGIGISNYDATGTMNVFNNIVCAEPRLGQYTSGTRGVLKDAGTVNSSYNSSWNNEIDYSGVTGGTGDITACPRFISAEAGDYRIGTDSPCNLGAGDYMGCYAPSGTSPITPEGWVDASLGSDDTGDGSEGEPWATISKAAGLTATKIHVLAGSYSESNGIILAEDQYLKSEAVPTTSATIDAGTSAYHTVTLGLYSTLEGFTVLKAGSGTNYAVYVLGQYAQVLDNDLLYSGSSTAGRALYAAAAGDNLTVSGNLIQTTSSAYRVVDLASGADYAVISSNTIESYNNTSAQGFGIYLTGNLSPSIEGNTIAANKGIGEAAACTGGMILNNIISAYDTNRTYGLALRGDHTVTGNLIRDYNGSGDQAIYLVAAGTYPIEHNTLVNNMIGIEAGAGTANARNNIINAGNLNEYLIGSIGLYDGAGSIASTYNDVYNNNTNYSGCSAGTGDISRYPRYVSAEANDFRLCSDSPCTNEGESGTYMGAYPSSGVSSGILSESWVDASAPNDDGPGDIDNPWKTVSKALKNTEYTINVKAGTYTENSGIALAQDQHLRSIASPTTAATIESGANAVDTVIMGSNATLEGFTISRTNTGTSLYAVDVVAANTSILSNKISAAVRGIGLSAAGTLVSSNDVTCSDASAYAIYAISGGSGSTIANNLLRNITSGTCIYLDTSANNITIRSNTIEAAGNAMYMMGSNDGYLISLNTCRGNGTGSGLDVHNSYSMRNGTICSNEVSNFTYGFTLQVGSSYTADIHNNTIVKFTTQGIRQIQSTGPGTINFRNNIVCAEPRLGYYLIGTTGAQLTYGVLNSTYNDYWGNETTTSGVSDGTGDINSYPRFISAEAENYRIGTDSPCATGGEGGTYMGCYPPEGTSSTNGDSWVDAVSGNDGNTGTAEGLAWKTLTKAIKQTANNIYVKAGTYNSANGETFPLPYLSEGQHLKSVASPTTTATIDSGAEAADTVQLGMRATMEGLTITRTDATADLYCVKVYKGSTVKNNYILGTVGGVQINDDGTLVSGNTINCPDASSFAVNVPSAGSDSTIENNIVYALGSGGRAVHLGVDANGMTVQNNTIEADTQGIYLYDENNNFYIANNRVKGRGTANSYGIGAGNTVYDILSGQILTNEVSDFHYGIFASIDPSDYVNIVNNTVADCNPYHFYGGNQTATYNILNNIIAGNPTGSFVAGTYGMYFTGTTATRNLDYNDVWNSETDYYNCSAGTHDISADPLFVDAADNDYHLTGSSPCVGTGTPEGADMGAYPYEAPTSITVILKTPNGGETWQAGTWNNITWESTGTPDNFRLYYITSEAEGWQSITPEASGTSYAWLVPNRATSTAKVSIEAVKAALIATDESDAVFNITATTNYYVNVVTGSNSYNGLTSEVSGINGPWKNVTYAATQAASGYIINVAAGTYNESAGESFPINVPASVRLKSIASPTTAATIETSGSKAVSLASISTVEGFTLKSAAAAASDGTVYATAKAFILTNIITCGASGRGVYLTDPADGSVVSDNDIWGGISLYDYCNSTLISGNTIEARPGTSGVYLKYYNSGNTITNNLIKGDQTSSGIYSFRNYNLYISSNEVRGFEDGMYLLSRGPAGTSTHNVYNNTIVGFSGDGIEMSYYSSSATYNIYNNIICANPYLASYKTGTQGLYESIAVTDNKYNNCLWSNAANYVSTNPGADDINVYPRFLDPANNDFRIGTDSPCADAGYGGTYMGRYPPVGSSGISAETWVDANSGNDTTGDGSEGTPWKSISHAIGRTDGTINAKAGTYDGSNGESFPLILAENLVLRSVASPTTLAIIDTSEARAVSLWSYATLEGFTVNAGGAADDGSVYMVGQYAQVISNTVTCDATGSGIYMTGTADYSRIKSNDIWGGISLYDSCNYVVIESNTIEARPGASGIYLKLYQYGYEIRDNVIKSNNTSSGIYGYRTQTGEISNNLIRNFEYGLNLTVHQVTHTITVRNNTVANNTYGITTNQYSGGIFNISNNIVAFGTKGIDRDNGTVNSTYNCLFANTTTYEGTFNTKANDIELDPRLVNVPANDYHLLYNSPCIDSGDPASALDPDGSRADRGAYYFDQTASATPAVYVITPNGGDSLTGYTNYEITWYATHDGYAIDHIELYYSTDGGSSFPNLITAGTANDGSYLWPVPNIATDQARVRVIAVGSAGTDESDSDFSIAEGPDNVVFNCDDDGPGSLRYVLASAEAGDEILFNIATAEVSTGEAYKGLVTSGSDTWFRIMVDSAQLPTITLNNIYLHGSTQTQEVSNSKGPEIEIRCASGEAYHGLYITGDSCTVEGLVFNGYTAISPGKAGVYIDGGDSNHVRNCYLGTTATGEAISANTLNIYLINSAQYNLIGGSTASERNLISGAGYYGVVISGCNSNEVKGNYIGTDRSGTGDLGNSYYPIYIVNGSKYNIVGGPTEGDRNIISGNNDRGVMIYGIGTNSNEVKGNYIGTDVTGTADLGNTFDGIYIQHDAQYNLIGGTAAGEGNLISGNDASGIYITGDLTRFNEVQGNYIGTDKNGTADLGNTTYGIYIIGGSKYNLIGSTESGGRNIISGNNDDGIIISGSGTNSNEVLGNYIGVDVTGEADLGNENDGIQIDGGAQYNQIGSGTAGGRNVISGNDDYGIFIRDSGTDRNEILGNYIGTDKDGLEDLGNSDDGIYIYNGPQYNLIGSTESGGRNIISGNDRHGIYVFTGGGSNEIIGNYIGTDLNGTADLGNERYGVWISNNTSILAIGPSNIIAYNGANGSLDGIYIDTGCTYIHITQNSMFDNYGQGIDLASGANNDIPYPDITLAFKPAGTTETTVTGTATPDATIEIFLTEDTPDPTGQGEGKTYLSTVTAEGSGSWITTLEGLSVGDKLTATANLFASPGYTSEFAENQEVASLSVTLEAPNGGETWPAGTWHNITWESTNSPDSFRLYYITSEAQGWQSITSEATGTSYAWFIPNRPTATAKVSIEAIKASEIVTDESNAVFTITAATNFYVNASTGSNSYNGLTTEVSGTNGPWKTITYASTASATGSTIHVAAGTYNATTGESFPITITGRRFISTVTGLATIDSSTTNVITMTMGASATLEGFIVNNAGGNYAVNMTGADSTLRNNRITVTGSSTGGRAYLGAGADRCLLEGNNIIAGSSNLYTVQLAVGADNPIIRNCTIESTYANPSGTAIYFDGNSSAPTVEGNTIISRKNGIWLTGNSANLRIIGNKILASVSTTYNGLEIRGISTGLVASNEVRGFDQGSGIVVNGASVNITLNKNTVVYNLNGVNVSSGTVNIQNCIISASPSFGAYRAGSTGIKQSSGTVTSTYNDLFNNITNYSGTVGNQANDITANPRFVNASGNDFRLYTDSPCKNTASDGGNRGAYDAIGTNSGITTESYVSPVDGTPAGDDSRATSSPDLPWATISRALGSTEGTVYARTGTYNAAASVVISAGQKLSNYLTEIATIDSSTTAINTVQMASNSTLEGMRIRNSSANAAIYLPGAEVQIKNNIINQNGSGYAVYFAAEADRCLLENNTITTGASGSNVLYFLGGADNPIIRGNTLVGQKISSAYVIYFTGTSAGPTIESNTITGAYYAIRQDGACTNQNILNNKITASGTNNYYGMMINGASTGTIASNEVRGWNSQAGSAGIYVQGAATLSLNKNTLVKNRTGIYRSNGSLNVKNNIIAAEIGDYSGDSTKGLEGAVTSTYNDVYANDANWSGTASGEGDISRYPQFVASGEANDFHLNYNSPCIDSGDPASALDPDGSRADMGAYYFDQTTSATPAVYVISPNGGQSLTGNTTYEITWSATHDGYAIDHIELYYSTDSGATFPNLITAETANDGSYIWTSPNITTSTTRVRVIAIGSAGTDESDSDFSITASGPSITVTLIAPNGGETWPAGTWNNITWESTGTPDSFRLYYITSEAEGWLSITSEASGTSYAWFVPDKPTSTAKVSIEAVKDTDIVTDESNAVFTISAPTNYYVNATTGSNESYNGLSSVPIAGTDNGPWKTITYAMANVTSGKTVGVATGTYNAANSEAFPISIPAGVHLLSIASPTTFATIDAEAANAHVISMAASSTIEGFTLKLANASASYHGIYLAGTSDNCTIKQNLIDMQGGNGYGLYLATSADGAIIDGNLIKVNTLGIHMYDNNLNYDIKNNRIIGSGAVNSYGIAQTNDPYGGRIAFNEVRDFYRGISLNIDNYKCTVESNTVVDCSNWGINFGCDNASYPVDVRNNIVCGVATFGAFRDGSVGIHGTTASPNLNIYNNDVWNYEILYENCSAGTGDISRYPRFVNAQDNDFTLNSDSPCATAGYGGTYMGSYAPVGGTSSVSFECYVDAVGGNDTTGDGSLGNPYKTIKKGLQSAEYIINVKAGTYNAANGEVFPSQSIRPCNNQTIRSVASPTSLATVDAGVATAHALAMPQNTTIEGITVKTGATVDGNYALMIKGPNCKVLNGLIRHEGAGQNNYALALDADSDDCLIEGNTIDAGSRRLGVYVISGATGCVVRENAISLSVDGSINQESYGIRAENGCSNTTAEGNVISLHSDETSPSFGHYGICYANACAGADIKNNVISLSGVAPYLRGVLLWGTGRVAFNEVRGGKEGNAGFFINSTGTVDILNNTAIENLTGIFCDAAGTVNARNNIIVGALPGDYLDASVGIDRDAAGVVNSSYNQLYNVLTDYDGDVSGKSQDLFSYPRFVDPSSHDYRLFSDSPCVGTADDGGNRGARGSVEAASAILSVSYVDANSGNDSNTGSNEANAWKTITKALSSTESTVRVLAGTYDSGNGENFPIKLAEGQTLVHYGTGVSTIDAGDIAAHAVWMASSATLEGMTVKTGSTTSGYYTLMVYGPNSRIIGNVIKHEGAGQHSYVVELDPDADNCLIEGNTIDAGTRRIGVHHLAGVTGSIVKSNTITINVDNAIEAESGGIWADAGCSNITAESNTIYVHSDETNPSYGHHGVYFVTSVTGADIKNNVASLSGVAPYLRGVLLAGTGRVAFNEVRGNGVGNAGFYINSTGTVDLLNNTAVENQNGLTCNAAGTVNATNNIFAYGTKGIDQNSGTVNSTYNCLFANTTTYEGTVNLKTGDIERDPKLVNMAADDNHLLYNSPCIDSGDPASTADPDGSRADMGAYYFDQTTSATPAIYVISPNGGQSLTGNTTYEITWSATHDGYAIDHIELYYSTDGGSTYPYTISDNTANDGSFIWTVNNITTSQGRVKVIAVGSAGTDESDSDFSVTASVTNPPTVEVTSPIGGEKWKGGSQHDITFTCTDETGVQANSASLYYSTGEGTAWITIDTGQPTTSAYAWTLPTISTTEVKVRVTVIKTGGLVGTGESPSAFTIDSIAPTVTIGKPNGGEIIHVLTNYEITWEASDNITTSESIIVTIHFSSNEGVSWSQVTSEANDGTYTWSVPDEVTSLARISIEAVDECGNIASTESASNFSLIKTLSIVLRNYNDTTDYTTWEVGTAKALNTVYIMTTLEAVLVKNDGDVSQDFSISAEASSWTLGSTADASQCVLMGLFNGDEAPVEGNYATANDLMTTTLTWATSSEGSGKYEGTNNGANVAINTGEKFYIYLKTPTSIISGVEELIRVTVGCKEHE